MKSNICDRLVSFIEVFIILIPLSLVTGPLIPDLLLSLTGMFFLYLVFARGLYKVFLTKFAKIFLTFYVVTLISALQSEHLAVSIKSILFYFRFGIFCFAVSYVLENNFHFLKKVFVSLFFFLLFVIVDAWVQYFFGYNFFGFPSFMQNEFVRITGLFHQDLKLGSFLARLFPFFIFSLFFLKIERMKKTILIFLICTYFLTVALTGERTSIFLLFMSYLFLLTFLIDRQLRIIVASSLFAAIFLSSILLISNDNLKNRIVMQTYNQIFNTSQIKINKSNQAPSIVAFSYIHNQHYVAALNIFKDNIFFGAGPKTFRIYCSNKKYSNNLTDACSTHPHNSYIQLLSETGIFSFLIISMIFFYFLYFSLQSIFRKNNFFKNNLQVCMTCCFLVTLWPLSPSGSFFNNWINIIYFFSVGFYLFSVKKNNRKII